MPAFGEPMIKLREGKQSRLPLWLWIARGRMSSGARFRATRWLASRLAIEWLSRSLQSGLRAQQETMAAGKIRRQSDDTWRRGGIGRGIGIPVRGTLAIRMQGVWPSRGETTARPRKKERQRSEHQQCRADRSIHKPPFGTGIRATGAERCYHRVGGAGVTVRINGNETTLMHSATTGEKETDGSQPTTIRPTIHAASQARMAKSGIPAARLVTNAATVNRLRGWPPCYEQWNSSGRAQASSRTKGERGRNSAQPMRFARLDVLTAAAEL